MVRFSLSEIQSRAIVDMRLRQLTGLMQDKLREEYSQIMALIEDLKDILGSEERRMQIISDELLQMKELYGDKRRTDIEFSSAEFSMEDMIPDDEMVISISNEGYVKRTSLDEYKEQARGGKGSKGAGSKDTDYIEHLFVATAHNYLLIFTEKGKLFWKRVYEIPEANKTAKGRPIQNLINIESDDSVKAVINVQNLKDEDYINNNHLVFCTEKGVIKKTLLEQYSRPRTNGINAITIREGDTLKEVRLTNGNSNIIIGLQSGRAIRFPEEKVRPMGRGAAGVRGVTLANDTDKVVGMVCVDKDNKEQTILVVSEKGYGKRTYLDDQESGEPVYRITNRGGKGVKTINVTEKTGNMVALLDVSDDDGLMIINKTGITIRLSVGGLRVMGRATQGVRLIKLKETDEITSVTKVVEDKDEEVEPSDLIEIVPEDELEELVADVEEEEEEESEEENESDDESNE